MTCSTASNSGKFAWSGVGIGEGTKLKVITFRLSDFFKKGLEHESGFFIATPRTCYLWHVYKDFSLNLYQHFRIDSIPCNGCTNEVILFFSDKLHNRTRANVRRQVKGIRAETYLHFVFVKWTTMAGKRKSTSLQKTSHVGDDFFFYIQLNWYLFIPNFLRKKSINGGWQ